MSLYGYDGDQSGGDSPDGEVFEYGSGNYHAKVRVDSFETVNYDHLGNPRVKLVATMLAGSKIAETHTPTKRSKLVSKQRSEILGREDDIISKSPYKDQVFELKDNFSFGGPVSPSHIVGVISGLSLNGATMLICSTGSYDGFPIGVVYACKHLTRELGIDVQPEQFRDWQTSYRAAFDSGEAGLDLVEFVWKTLGDGNGLSQPIEEQITIEDLQTNPTAANDSASKEPTEQWGWDDTFRPTELNITHYSRFMMRFHCKASWEEAREGFRAEYNRQGHSISVEGCEKSYFPRATSLGLWRRTQEKNFEMTDMGEGLATGKFSFKQYMECLCDRWQHPRPRAKKHQFPGRLRPMIEIVRTLRKLGDSSGYPAHLNSVEQKGFIHDVATAGDVDGFVECVQNSRASGVYPKHWQGSSSKAMAAVGMCLVAAGRVSKGEGDRLELQ